MWNVFAAKVSECRDFALYDGMRPLRSGRHPILSCAG